MQALFNNFLMLKERALAFVEFSTQGFLEYFLGSYFEEFSDEEIYKFMLEKKFKGPLEEYIWILMTSYTDFMAEINAVLQAVQVVIASLMKSANFSKLEYDQITRRPTSKARRICYQLAKQGKPRFVFEWMQSDYDSLPSIEQKQFADEMEDAIAKLIWKMYIGRYVPIAAGSDNKFMFIQIALMYNDFFSEVYTICYDMYLPSNLKRLVPSTFINVSDLLAVMPDKYESYFIGRAPNPDVDQ